MKNFGTENAENMCLKLIIAKKKWWILFTYRPPDTNKTMFFNEIYVTLNKILDNILLAGDLNIDELKTGSDSSNHFSDAKDVFNLTNLVKKHNCFKSQVSILRASFKKRPKKIITYRDKDCFNQDHFLRDFDSRLLQGELYRNCDEPHENFLKFLTIHLIITPH